MNKRETELFNAIEKAKFSLSAKCTHANMVVAVACNIINRLTDSISGYELPDIDISSVFDVTTECPTADEDTRKCSTAEEFVGTVKTIMDYESKMALDKFTNLSKDALKEIRKHQIQKDQKDNIMDIMDKELDRIIVLIRNTYPDTIMKSGFNLENVPVKDHVNCITFVKQSMQEMAEDIAKAFVDEICEGSSLTIKPNENQVQQQMATPMVQMGAGFNPVPNFSDDQDISRHFVIGNNVVIYDPNQQVMFKSLLKSLAQQLDQKDKEAGLTEPSKFGFSQFYNTGQFVAVRLNSENCFIPIEDTDNFMCIVMDNGNVSLTMPSKAA